MMWIIFMSAFLPMALSACSKVKYADETYDEVLHSFFNKKIVAIAYYSKKTLIVPGIFIDFHLILTSYNPFRKDREYGKNLDIYRVCVLKSRTKVEGAYVFKASAHKVVCARQIIPVPYRHFLDNSEYHGFNKDHSPMHDMMVLRIAPREYAVRSGYSLLYGASIGFKFPVPVHVAKQFYELRNKHLTIASLGFRDYDHMRDSDTILSRRYSIERVMADCDEWMPRWWGHFICIKNVDNFKGIGSGALLIHSNALFGIGSFMLSKRNHSILVFTDVRKYYRMYGSACHEFEATEISLREGYDRDEFWYYAHHKATRNYYKYIKKNYD